MVLSLDLEQDTDGTGRAKQRGSEPEVHFGKATKGDGVAEHNYTAKVTWTGNRGQGNVRYRGYDRKWEVRTPGKPVIECSNDPLLGGDPGLHNPEDMLIAALSACHMLWYLHLASDAGILVSAYEDEPIAVGESLPNGAGRFLSATLRPRIMLGPSADRELADALHGRIHETCFIARSVNFPVNYAAEYIEG